MRHAQPATIVVLATTRSKRRRAASDAQWPGKPLGLSEDERQLLNDWAAASAATRKWAALREAAGIDRLDLAERLATKLLALGVWTVQEAFQRARWELKEIAWCDLPTLQTELGLETAAEKQAQRLSIDEQLEQLLADELVGEAAAAVLESRLAAASKRGRAELLRGLSLWVQAQRSGLRQDFALHARPHTKAITAGEWAWLDSSFDLAGLAVGRFKTMIWLAGAGRLLWSGGGVDLPALPLIALPCEHLQRLTAVQAAPNQYWLIENRASFERQAEQLPPGCCLIWTAGRPSHAWLRGVQALLLHAPAPVNVSADADPAGIEIALAAVEPWRNAGLPWLTRGMEIAQLETSKRQPLNGYDEQCLQRLFDRSDLPDSLRELALGMQRLQGKAEQEAWL